MKSMRSQVLQRDLRWHLPGERLRVFDLQRFGLGPLRRCGQPLLDTGERRCHLHRQGRRDEATLQRGSTPVDLATGQDRICGLAELDGTLYWSNNSGHDRGNSVHWCGSTVGMGTPR
jgi:hypothetical protein